jgi:hypothetical protein
MAFTLANPAENSLNFGELPESSIPLVPVVTISANFQPVSSFFQQEAA